MDTDQPAPQLSVTEKVVEAVATHTKTDPLELLPLCTTLDGDALNAFVAGLESGMVDFQYAGTAVTVHSGGTVNVVDTPRRGSSGRVRESAE